MKKNKIDAPVANIDITIKSLDDFYSRYSMEGSEVISPDLVDFIDINNDFKNKNTSLNLNFHIDAPLDDIEMTTIKNTIQRQYTQEKNNVMLKLKRQVTLGTVCLALGLSFGLAAAVALVFIFKDLYLEWIPLAVFMFIFAWTLIWVGMFWLLRSYVLSNDRTKCKRVLSANIKFMNK